MRAYCEPLPKISEDRKLEMAEKLEAGRKRTVLKS
jgi:hypothetical protein